MKVAHLDGSNPFPSNINAGSGDVSVNQSNGTFSLDLVTQLRQARDKVQRKMDELLTRHPMDEPVVLSASCEQLRTFLGQLEAYNFRVGAFRARSQSANCSKSLNGTDRDIDLNQLETIWSSVVQQAETWFSTLQKVCKFILNTLRCLVVHMRMKNRSSSKIILPMDFLKLNVVM